MERNSLRELYVDELRDLYDAENRLVKALPKLAKASTSAKLRSAFEGHLEQTRGHVDRLEEIFKKMGEKPTGKKCVGIMGIVKEGDEMLHEDFEGGVRDAALISAGQRAEHYEMAAYGCVKTWAKVLGEVEASALLGKTLDEEKEADQKLSELAKEINMQARNQSENERGEEGEQSESEESEGKPHRIARRARA
jgi:ferritin-like metal-binding protein YciE